MVSWQFLLIGGLAAVGAALAVGTLAAMVAYRRTGSFPGRPEGEEPTEVSAGQLVGLWLRVVIGMALAIWGVVSLSSAGLL
ncbi:MAG TPA: hypothetical protein VGA36_10790 [Nitriliruptorales bacterium]